MSSILRSKGLHDINLKHHFTPNQIKSQLTNFEHSKKSSRESYISKNLKKSYEKCLDDEDEFSRARRRLMKKSNKDIQLRFIEAFPPKSPSQKRRINKLIKQSSRILAATESVALTEKKNRSIRPKSAPSNKLGKSLSYSRPFSAVVSPNKKRLKYDYDLDGRKHPRRKKRADKLEELGTPDNDVTSITSSLHSTSTADVCFVPRTGKWELHRKIKKPKLKNEEIKQAWIPHPPVTPKVSKESSIAEDAAECIYELEIKSKFGASRENFTVSFYGDANNKVLSKSFEITETMQRVFEMSYTDHVAFYGTDVGSLSKISIHHYSNGNWDIDEIMIRKSNEVFRFHCRTSFPPTYSADTLNRTYLIVNMQKKIVDSNENSQESQQESVSIHSEIKRPKTAFGRRYKESETENSSKTSKVVLPPLEVRAIVASNENGSSTKSPTSPSSKASDLKSSTKEPKTPLKSVKLEKLDLKSSISSQNNEGSEKVTDNVSLSEKDSNKNSSNSNIDPLPTYSIDETTKPSLKKEVAADVSENSKSLQSHQELDVEQSKEKSKNKSSKEDSSLSVNESEKTLLSSKIEKESSKSSTSESSCTNKTFSKRSKELTNSESSKATNKSSTSLSKRSSTSSESTSQSESSTNSSLETSLSSKTTQNIVTKLSKNSFENEKNLGVQNESSDDESTTVRNEESLKVSSKG